MRSTFSVIVLMAALAFSSHVNAKQKGTKMDKDLEGMDYQGSDSIFKEPEPREEDEPLPSEDELREQKHKEYREEYDEKSENSMKSVFADLEEYGVSWNLDADITEEMKNIDTLKFVYVTDSVRSIPEDETQQDWRMLDLMFYKTLTELKGGYVKTFAYDCQWDGATNFEWEEFKESHGCNREEFQPFFSLQKSPDVKTNPYTGKRMEDVNVPFDGNELTEPKVKAWFTNNLPDYTQSLKSEVDAEQFDAEEGISKVYLFSSKKATPPIYKALAANYNNRLRFAIVKKESPVAESLAAEFKVTKWPTLLINVQKGTEIENIVYEGKLKLPELNSFVDEYALSKSEAKADYYIASKTQEEMKANSAKQGYRVVDSIDKMKDIVLDDMFAGLVYVTEKDQLPHLSVIEQFAEVYGDFINIVVLTLDDPKEAKKEFKGKLPQFRFYRNEVKGQAKRDTSFEVLIPDRLDVTDTEDAKEIFSIIDGEIQDNFENYVKEVTEKMYYPLARAVTTDEQKHSIAWCYDDDKGATFIFKALSADPFLSQSFSFFAIDSPDKSIVQGEEFPALAGMLAITEENPSPRIFSLNGGMIKDYFTTVVSLIKQLVPEKADALEEYRLDRKGLKKEKQTSSAAPREFIEIRNQADLEAVCFNRTACAIAILPTLLDIDYEAENHKQRLQIVNLVSERAEKAVSPLHLAWINGTCHREIFNYFDVDPTQIPSVVFYTQGKNKHATMIGKFDLTTIGEQADLFMKGGLPVFRPKVDKRDIVIEDKDCSIAQADAPAEDDGFDDILAEILAEEEAARAEQERLDAENQKASSGKKKGDKKKGDKKKKNKKKKEAAKDEL